MKIYKPNPRSTGCAASFSINSIEQSVFLEIIKQVSWCDKSKVGKFDSSKENKINIKFSAAEVAGMMEICQRRKGKKSYFHKSDAGSAQITMSIYEKDGQPQGISLSVTKGDKKAAVPISWDEGNLLFEYFRFALGKMFSAQYTAEKKLFENRNKEQ